MALDAYTQLEMRTTGGTANGAGFSGNIGTPQLSLTDLACTKGSTTVTSATGGFTAGMVGCHLVVTTNNGNWPRGSYLIKTRSDTNTITVDRSPCPAASGTAGAGLVSAGTDYSQQDSAQASGTSGTTDAGGTTFTDSTANAFTAAMVGNCIWIASGTGATVGLYQVTAYTSSSVVTLDRSAGTSASAISWKLGGAWYGLNSTLATFLKSMVAGNTCWVKAGTYTLTANSTSINPSGTYQLPINLIGYNTTRGDGPTGTSRPVLALASNNFGISGSYWYITGMRFSQSSGAFSCGQNVLAVGCKFSATASSSALVNSAAYVNFVSCEFYGAGNYGLTNCSSGSVVNCYFTGVSYGSLWSSDMYWVGCVFDACAIGPNLSSYSRNKFYGCSFVCCGTGVLFDTASGNALINSLFAYCAIGASFTTTIENDLFVSNNNFFGCVTDVSGRMRTPTDTAYDPAFAALHTWTDLASTHGTNVITSATGGFDTHYQVGDYIYIGAGTNWTPGAYRITTVTSGTSITLSTDPTTSTATGGTAYTLRTAVGVSDCRLGASSSCRTAGMNLTLGVG